jgi:hypothetical protein
MCGGSDAQRLLEGGEAGEGCGQFVSPGPVLADAHEHSRDGNRHSPVCAAADAVLDAGVGARWRASSAESCSTGVSVAKAWSRQPSTRPAHDRCAAIAGVPATPLEQPAARDRAGDPLNSQRVRRRRCSRWRRSWFGLWHTARLYGDEAHAVGPELAGPLPAKALHCIERHAQAPRAAGRAHLFHRMPR